MPSRTVASLKDFIEQATSGRFPHFIVLDLPAGCDEDHSVMLLSKWSRDISQAAHRNLHFGGPRYQNLPDFLACRQVSESGRARWLITGGYDTASRSAFELPAIKLWNYLAPTCGVHVYPGGAACAQQARAWLDRGDEIRIYSAQDFGVPAQETCSNPGLEVDAVAPARPFLVNRVRLGELTPFFSNELIPPWADERVWLATDCKGVLFGFSTRLDRNGFGDCLVAHSFHTEGDAIVSSERAVPALKNSLGLNLQDNLHGCLSSSITVRPLIGTAGMAFLSGEDLYEAIFGQTS